MDKVFNLEIDGQITLPDGSKLGPLYDTPIKIVQPSDADAAIENAKETGGFGWTETKSDTVNITWDGDTTGKETVESRGITLCLVNNKTPESMLGYNVKFSTGESFTATDDNIFAFDWGYMLEAAAVVVVFNDNTTVSDELTFEHKGVYFAKVVSEDYFVAEVSEPAETVHTIDSKYIGGDGDFIMNNAIFVKENDDESTMDDYPYVSVAGEESGRLFMIMCEQQESTEGAVLDYISIAPRRLIGGYVFTSGISTDFDGKDYLDAVLVLSSNEKTEQGHILFPARFVSFEYKVL